MFKNIKHSYILLIVVLLLSFFVVFEVDNKTDYWVWGWGDMVYVPKDSPVVLYQGDYMIYGGALSFVKRGVDPNASFKNNDVSLLVRVYVVENPELLAKNIGYLISEWRGYGVVINHVQLDYDSPSAGLDQYSEFISELKTNIDGLEVQLSSTGLLAWLHDNPSGVKKVAEQVSFITYQLYSDFHPVTGLDSYYPAIKGINYPYKIGVTTSFRFSSVNFPKNSSYIGQSVFLNIK